MDRSPRGGLAAAGAAPLTSTLVFSAGPRTYTAHAHRNVRAAASFLAWLHGRGRALADCQQAERVARGTMT